MLQYSMFTWYLLASYTVVVRAGCTRSFSACRSSRARCSRPCSWKTSEWRHMAAWLRCTKTPPRKLLTASSESSSRCMPALLARALWQFCVLQLSLFCIMLGMRTGQSWSMCIYFLHKHMQHGTFGMVIQLVTACSVHAGHSSSARGCKRAAAPAGRRAGTEPRGGRPAVSSCGALCHAGAGAQRRQHAGAATPGRAGLPSAC